MIRTRIVVALTVMAITSAACVSAGASTPGVLQSADATGAASPAESPPPSEPILRSLDPDSSVPTDEVVPSPTPPDLSTLGPLPDGLNSALRSAKWIMPGEKDDWIVGDYAGDSAAVSLSPLASFTEYGAFITAVDRVDGTWRLYDVDVKGSATPLFSLPAVQPNVLATRSSDGQRIYVHSGAADIDGGLQQVDLSTGTVRELVKGQPTPGRTRGLLIWSDTQTTLFSSLCSLDTCYVDVVNDSMGRVRRLSGTFGVRAASDKYALGYSSAAGPIRPWEIYDLASDTTETVAKKWIAETEEGVAIGGDSFAVAGWSADHKTYSVVVVNAVSRDERLLYSQTGEHVARLQRYLAGFPWVLLSADPLGIELLRGGGRADVLTIADGKVLPAAAVVRATQP